MDAPSPASEVQPLPLYVMLAGKLEARWTGISKHGRFLLNSSVTIDFHFVLFSWKIESSRQTNRITFSETLSHICNQNQTN
jgi:hypothetical protein